LNQKDKFSFKALDFEKAYVRNINSVSNLDTFSHITLPTTTIVTS